MDAFLSHIMRHILSCSPNFAICDSFSAIHFLCYRLERLLQIAAQKQRESHLTSFSERAKFPTGLIRMAAPFPKLLYGFGSSDSSQRANIPPYPAFQYFLPNTMRIAFAGAHGNKPDALGIKRERRYGMPRFMIRYLFFHCRRHFVDGLICIKDIPQHRAHDVFAPDFGFIVKTRIDTRLVEHRFKRGAGISVHQPCNTFRRHVLPDFFIGKIMPYDFHRLFAIRRTDFKNAVKSSGATQRTRQFIYIVCRGNHKHIRPFHIVNPRLHRDEFFRISRTAIGSKFIDVIQKDDGRRMFLRLRKKIPVWYR